MRNYIAPGQSIDFTAGEDETYVAGQGYVKGSAFGVAANDAIEGQTVTLHLTGIYSFTGAGDAFAKAFWDDTDKEVSGTSGTGLFEIGTIVGVDGTKRQVRLNGVGVTAVPGGGG